MTIYDAECMMDQYSLISKRIHRMAWPTNHQNPQATEHLKANKWPSQLKLVEELDNKLPPPNTDPHVDVEVDCAYLRNAVGSEVLWPITR